MTTKTRDVYTNCQDVFKAGYTDNGVYTVTPSNWNETAFNVFCNMSEGDGWTVSKKKNSDTLVLTRHVASSHIIVENRTNSPKYDTF